MCCLLFMRFLAIAIKATLNKSLLALFSGRETEVNSDSLPPNPSRA
jgi:hypothetical protein